MRVKFGIALGQFGQEAVEKFAIHPAVLEETEYVIGVVDVHSLQAGPGPCRQSVIDQPVAHAVEPMAWSEPGIQPEWIAGQPDMTHIQDRSVAEHETEDDGMLMDVQMPVDVIQRQAGLVEAIKLRRDFSFELRPQPRQEKIAESGENGTGRKLVVPIHETGDP